MEEFKLLKEFLDNTQKQLLSELLSISWKSDTAKTEAGVLTAQINLLGVISGLPRMVQEIKAQFDLNEANMSKAKAANFDPLNIEGA